MNSPNFSEIAARVAAGSDDVRACLVVSSDGLTLGVFPEDREDAARAAWGRMVASGDPEPERGFLAMGEEIWAFVRRGGYGALAVGTRTVRPGLLLDALDAALKEAHQERVDTAAEVRETRRSTEPVRRSRTAIHPETPPARRPAEGARPEVRTFDADELIKLQDDPVVIVAPVEDEAEMYEAETYASEPEPAPAYEPEPEPAAEPVPARAARRPAREPEPEPAPEPAYQPAAPVNVPVDTAELTREFGGLFDGPGSR